MSKILVTGGAGYIGSHTILEILSGNKWDVISADNYSNSSADTFTRIKSITGKNVRNYTIDLCNKEKATTIFKEHRDISAIIHFAAFKSVPESVEKPELYRHNNMDSLANMLWCVKEFNIPHFIFSSSCSVYGQIDKLPVNEDTPFNKALSPYGETKQKGEEMLMDFCKTNAASVKTIALRYFNPAGAHPSGKIGEMPTERPNNLAPMITGTAMGKYKELLVHGHDYPTRDGTCVRDYIHVCDIARAHTDALTYLENNKTASAFSVFNLGSGNGVTVLEMIKAFEKVSGKKLNYRLGERRSGDVASIYTDINKAMNILHWKPIYTLDEMMLSAWKWELAYNRKS